MTDCHAISHLHGQLGCVSNLFRNRNKLALERIQRIVVAHNRIMTLQRIKSAVAPNRIKGIIVLVITTTTTSPIPTSAFLQHDAISLSGTLHWCTQRRFPWTNYHS